MRISIVALGHLKGVIHLDSVKIMLLLSAGIKGSNRKSDYIRFGQ